MSITAAQLIAEISIPGSDDAVSILVGIGSAAGDAQEKMDMLGAASQEAGGQISAGAEEGSGGFLSGIGNMVGGIMDFGNKLGMTIFGFQNLWNMAGNVAQGLLGPAESAETVTTALTTMDGSAKAAGQEMQALNSFAAKTPFKTLDIDQAAEQLQGFGYQASQVVPMITSIGDALGSVGKETPAEMMSVVDVFGKMRTEGKVTAMTMNELAVHGIDAWKALSDGSGKTIPQLQEMVKKGLLPANDAVEYLTKGIEKNPLYQGGMARAAGTFTGLLSTLQSNWDQVIAAFGTPIIKGLEGSLNNLGNILSSPVFQSFAGAIGQGIVDAFSGIGSAVGTVVGYLKNFDLTSVSYAFRQLGDAISPIFSSLSALGSNKEASGFFTNLKNDLSQGLVKAIEDVSGFIEGLAGSINSLGKNKDFQGFLSSIGSGLSQIGSIIGGQVGADFQTFQGILKSLGDWWKSTMAPAIESVMPSFERLGSIIFTNLVPAFAQMWATGQQIARQLLPPLTQAFETVAPIVVRIAGILATQLGNAIQFLSPYLKQATQAIGDFASQIISRVIPVVQEIWSEIQKGIAFVLPIWEAVWPSMQQILKGAWDIISGIVKVAWSLISGIIKVGLDLLSGNWKQAWQDIQDTFSGVWDGIKSVVEGVWTAIGGAIKGGIDFVIGLINSFIGGIDKIGIDVGPVHLHPNIPKIPLLAAGGTVMPGGGGFGIVGDQGPEGLFLPPGAQVVPNNQLGNLLGGGPATNQPLILQIDGRQFARVILPSLTNEMRYRLGTLGI